MKEKQKNILKWAMVVIYSLLSLYTPLIYFPKSVKWFDFLYSYVKFSEYSFFTLIKYEIIFATFMLFFCFLIKESCGNMKTTYIYLLNVVIPVVGLLAQVTEGLTLFVLAAFVLIFNYTIQTALNISIKISVAKENKTEAEASE